MKHELDICIYFYKTYHFQYWFLHKGDMRISTAEKQTWIKYRFQFFHCELSKAILAWRISWNYDDYILFKWTLPLSLFTHKSWLKIDDRSRNYLIFLGKWLLLIQEIKNTICSISRIKISLTILWKLTTAENDLARILKTVRADLGGAEARCSKLGSCECKNIFI